MGCVAGKPDINDLHPNIFQVVNVDDIGHRFSVAAKLEVTDSDLVLHQRGKSAIRWPLRCLRRYGFDAELFSFEAGRRCPTGPGIFAFKCRRAEALFNMLQLHIQNITEDAASRDVATLPPQVVGERDLTHDDSRNSTTAGAMDLEGYLEPVQRPLTRIPNNVPLAAPAVSSVSGVSSVGAVSGNIGVGMPYGVATGAVGGACGMGSIHSPASPPTPLSPPPTSFYENDVNRTEEMPPTPGHEMRNPPPTPTEPRPVLINHVDKTVTYDNNHSGRPGSFTYSYPDRPRTHINFTKHPISYVNIPHSKSNVNKSVNKNDTCIVYANIGLERHHLGRGPVYENMQKDKDVPVVPPRPSLTAGSAGSGSSHSGTTTTTDTEQQRINYIMVDIDPGSDSSQAPPSSPIGSVTSGPESPQHRINAVNAGYAVIDIAKTEALNKVAQAGMDWEDGSRKTRHNSTFTSQSTLTRHNSSLSD